MATNADQPGALLHLRGAPDSTTARSEGCYQKQQSRADTQMLALKRDHRGTPAVVEAVRQRCSHFAATKADQVFDVICAVLQVKRMRLQCLPVTSQYAGHFQ